MALDGIDLVGHPSQGRFAVTMDSEVYKPLKKEPRALTLSSIYGSFFILYLLSFLKRFFYRHVAFTFYYLKAVSSARSSGLKLSVFVIPLYLFICLHYRVHWRFSLTIFFTVRP